MAKTDYHHGDLKEALIRVADGLLAEVGVAGTSLRAAARRAGVSQTAPYRHFPDKEALLAAVATRGFEEFRGRLERGADLVAMGVAYVRFALDRPALFNLMFGPQFPHPERHPELTEAAAAAQSVLFGAVQAGQESGAFQDGPVEELALLPWTAVHGLSIALINGSLRTETPMDIAQRVAELVRTGLDRR